MIQLKYFTIIFSAMEQVQEEFENFPIYVSGGTAAEIKIQSKLININEFYF